MICNKCVIPVFVTRLSSYPNQIPSIITTQTKVLTSDPFEHIMPRIVTGTNNPGGDLHALGFKINNNKEKSKDKNTP